MLHIPSLSLRKAKGTLGAVFDVGTSSVSAVVFEVGAGGKPNIKNLFRRFHKPAARRELDHLNKITVGEFSNIMKEIAASRDGLPAHYTIGLSSLFYLGKTEHFSFEDRKSPLRHQDFEALLHQSSIRSASTFIFESVFMKVLLNGYPVANPFGKTADEVEIWSRVSGMPNEMKNTITRIVESFKRGADVRFATLPVSAWKLLSGTMIPEGTAIFVDIGGEFTEVTFINEGIIADVVSLPFGIFHIVLRISEEEKVDLANAFSLLVGYAEGSLSEEMMATLRKLIKGEVESWEEIFERVWQYASRDFMSNIKIFFLGSGALVDEITHTLTPPLLHPEIARELTVSILKPEAFREQFGEYHSLEGPADFGLVALMLGRI